MLDQPLPLLRLLLCSFSVYYPANQPPPPDTPGVVLSVHEEPGSSILIEELFKAARVMNSETRAASMGLLHALCDRSTADLTEHIPQLIIFTAEALNDPSDIVCERAWHALEATVKVG